MTGLIAGIGGILALCLAGFAFRFPVAATVGWLLLIETSPDIWMTPTPNGHEAMIAGEKFFGLLLVAVLGLRCGWRRDAWNPAFAFLWIFCAGLVHGLYPGLSVGASFRSLLGSAGPTAFGFAGLPAPWVRAVVRTVILGPVWAVAVGGVLAAAGVHPMYDLEQGALRLGGPGEPAFLAGFALISIYAGILEWLARRRRQDLAMLGINFLVLLATGARAPLALAALLLAVLVLLPAVRLSLLQRLAVLSAGAAAFALAAVFAASLHILRVVTLVQLGEAGNLSNRTLIWSFFLQAFHTSKFVGWGLGAGKVVVPVHSQLAGMIGTNAAHNEYLRMAAEGGLLGLALLVALLALWAAAGTRALPPAEKTMARLVFVAFAAHSATDNTLIATTSSVFFIWAAALFASARAGGTEAA